MDVDLREVSEKNFKQISNIIEASEIAVLFDNNGMLKIEKFLDVSEDRNIRALVTLRGSDSDSYGEINKAILSLGVGSGDDLATVIVTDDPVPILVPAVVGIVAVAVTHYLNCNSSSTIHIKILPKFWGGIEIKSECG